MVDERTLERLVDWAFAGLALYYRDTPLSAAQLGHYRVGTYLRNSFFLDVTSFSAGLVGDTRFIIGSSKAAPLYQVMTQNPDLARWKLHVLNANSFFKVLDVAAADGKTQITLLHVPRRWVIQVPPSTTTNLEQHLVQVTRHRWDEKRGQPPAPELAEPAWCDRVTLPVGLDDQDQPTPLDGYAPVAHPLASAIDKLVDDPTDLNR